MIYQMICLQDKVKLDFCICARIKFKYIYNLLSFNQYLPSWGFGVLGFWGSKALWTMLKETAILRPALWAPKYLGGRILFRLRFRLKTFVFWRKKYEAKSCFSFSQLGWDQIWQCFEDLLSKADKLFQFSFGSGDIPIVGYLTLLVTQGNNDHIDIIHYKLDENEFC